ncbi:putative cell death regulator Aven [Apostichopus japonicus]|uniref:Putative cell death regulator Aven n=1 Tax=Stichopus japonicus TaxID=307972 RepID=A0A2G8JS42_STIJA|nr:putative cell death regulator Aven [Apostichopus japonicus]
MRPDKHKKKQHAAYAKKTAQKNKKSGNTSNDTTNTNSQPRSKPRPRTSGNTSENSVRADDIGFTIESKQFKGSSRNELSLNSNLTEDKDNVTSFSRRQIESNWQQYDELPGDQEIVHHRGADFMLLLTQTAGSQFRFKDEETLDEDTTQQEGSTSLFSFDCNELADKLQTISLPERLEIPRTVFDMEMLEILDQDATTSNTFPSNQINTTVQQGIPSMSKQEETSTSDNELEDILARSQTDRSVLQQSMHADLDPNAASKSRLEASSLCQEREAEEEVHQKGVNSDRLPSNSLSNPVESSAKHSEDDELDFLLSLGSPVVESNSHQSKLKDEIEEMSRLQGGTLASLILHNESTQEVLARPAQNSSVGSSDVQTTESLDDWLDSILED